MTTQSVLTGDDLRELMEQVLPQEAITELVEAAKFQERTRKRDAIGLIRALVIAASTGYMVHALRRRCINEAARIAHCAERLKAAVGPPPHPLPSRDQVSTFGRAGVSAHGRDPEKTRF